MPKNVRKSTDVRKQEIIKALIEIIITKGSEHATVRELAKKISISQPAIYRHFKNKIEIFFFLSDFIKNILIKDIEFVKNAQLIKDFKSIISIFSIHIENIEKRNGVSFMILAEIISLGDMKLNKKISEITNQYISEISKILNAAAAIKIFNKNKINEEVSAGIYGIIHGNISKWILDNHHGNISNKITAIIEIFLKSLT